VLSLDTLATLYYNEDYDNFNPSENVVKKPLEEKRMMFYKLLKLGNKRHILTHRK
jgi:hypothetical protein